MKTLFATIHHHREPRAIGLASYTLAALINDKIPGTFSADALDLYPDQNTQEKLSLLMKSKPEVFGFTLYLWNRLETLEIITKLKAAYPQCIILAGGPEVTAAPSSFQHEKGIDYLISGEGEEPLLELYKTPLTLSPKENPQIVKGKYYPLKNSPSPLLSKAGFPPKEDAWLLELSRGCPFQCFFCYESKGGNQVRHFPLKRIEMELKALADSHVKQVWILDPTFNARPPVAKELLKLFLKTAPDLHYFIEIRSEFLDEEQAELYSQLNCTIQLGLQTANPRAAKAIGRPFDREKFMDKLYMLHQLQVPYGLDLIYGLPEDSLHSFKESLNYALSLQPNHLDIFPLALLPGTILYEKADELQLKRPEQPPYILEETPTFTKEEIKEAQDLARKIDLIYNRGKGVSWLSTLTESLDITHNDFFIAPLQAETSDPLKDARIYVESVLKSCDREDLASFATDCVAFLQEVPEEMQKYQPQSLEEHLNMGITDWNELMLFVKKK